MYIGLLIHILHKSFKTLEYFNNFLSSIRQFSTNRGTRVGFNITFSFNVQKLFAIVLNAAEQSVENRLWIFTTL